MQINRTPIETTCTEADVYNALFDFAGKCLLDLGCGAASHTRKIAEAYPTCHVDACEVDQIQHQKNLNSDAPANMTFKEAGAEDIPANDNTYDIVFMFKSLHHVPMDRMDQALREIKRVLKPGGTACIFEPVYAGDYNEVMRLFHDEKEVREHACAAMKQAIAQGLFVLKEQIFFNTVCHFDSFTQFQAEYLAKTYIEDRPDEAVWATVRQQFEKNLTGEGAEFLQPHRVDVLQA